MAAISCMKIGEQPAEEVVILEEGADYGWPQCYYDGQSQKFVLAPEYDGGGGSVRRHRQFAPFRSLCLRACVELQRGGQRYGERLFGPRHNAAVHSGHASRSPRTDQEKYSQHQWLVPRQNPPLRGTGKGRRYKFRRT
jgi:hypothetical protein